MTTPHEAADARLATILSYAAIAPVLPLWGTDEQGRCRCSKRGKCGSAGKHPIAKLVPMGVKDATTDTAKLTAWFTEHADANVGIAMGYPIGGDPERGYMGVLDIDTRNDGTESLSSLCAQHGQLAETWQALTGWCALTQERGSHFYYRWEKAPRCGIIGDGVEIKGAGGYVVAAPSRHTSGVLYTWEATAHPEEIPLAAAPAWIVDALGAPREVDGAESPLWTGEDAADTLLGHLFAGHGWLGVKLKDGMRAVRCPWHSEHTGGVDGEMATGTGTHSCTAIGPPNTASRLGWFRCHHAHCAGRHRDEVLRTFKELHIQRAGAKAGFPKASVDRLIRRCALNVVTMGGTPLNWGMPISGQPLPSPPGVMPPPAAPAPTNWQATLTLTPRGGVEKSATNVWRLLSMHPDWQHPSGHRRLRLDTAAGRMMLVAPPYGGVFGIPPAMYSDAPRVFSGSDVLYIQAWARQASVAGVTFPEKILEAGIAAAAAGDLYNPLHDWLMGLTWDGHARLDTWLSRYLGTDDTPYTRQVGRWWLISVCARGVTPGCAIDGVLVLEGPEGTGKSTALRILGETPLRAGATIGDGRVFAEVTAKISDAKAFSEQVRGRWIVELPELVSLRGRVEEVKAMLTIRTDTYRPPFSPAAMDFLRTCGFAATTNDKEYLPSKTGNRRFYPVVTGPADLAALERDAVQLFAEAMAAWHAGAAWYPRDEAEWALCKGEQGQRETGDPWEEATVAHLEARAAAGEDWTATQLVHEALVSLGLREVTEGSEGRVRAILRKLGWESSYILTGRQERKWVIVPPLGRGHEAVSRYVTVWRRRGV